VSSRVRFAPRVFELHSGAEPAQLVRRLAPERAPVLLDRAAVRGARCSVLGFDPLALPLDAARGIAGVRELALRLVSASGDEVPGPFHGGFLGAFAYDLGVAGERAVDVAPEPWGFPLVVGGLYVDFIVRDEHEGRAWLVLGDEPGDGRADVASRRRELERLLQEPAADERRATCGELVRHTSPREHARRIELARAAIARGDYYQANLAHRFTCECTFDAPDLYARLRRANPAPYMGFAAWRRGERSEALLSASPELLLDFDGETARTRPIKGTAPRSQDRDEDADNAARLLASEKDRAELAMIVDLERNDLGRIAEAGGVRVEGFPTLASYARVHHTYADVVARVRPRVDAFDVLAALFPGGSVTGAPKLAAMDAIARLEGEGRGFFCGSLGFVDTRGRAGFNILIRTLLWRPGEVSFRVGGGITWSSDPAAEDRETLDKAAGLIDALR
jgi:para-aminobenzoate synthetase component 1